MYVHDHRAHYDPVPLARLCYLVAARHRLDAHRAALGQQRSDGLLLLAPEFLTVAYHQAGLNPQHVLARL